MAGKGLYGVFARKCVKTEGVTTGYEGDVILLGKAISAEFTANTPEENPLYANNGVGENDNSSGSGGELTLVLDRMTLETAAALYGTEVSEVTVQVREGEEAVSGKEITYKGLETSAPYGTAYIKLHQEDGVNLHEVMFYRESTFSRPDDSAQTMEESIEWQTPSITGNVMGMQGDGAVPWYRVSRWPSQEAAIAYIYQLFGAAATENDVSNAVEALKDEEEVAV